MALDLNDKTANGNTLTNTGATESSDTGYASSTKSALLVASEVDYLEASDSASLSITGNFTLEVMVKFVSTPSSGNRMTFISKYTVSGNQRSYEFGLRNSGGTLQLYGLVSNDGSGESEFTTNWTPTTGVWYRVSLRYNTTGSTNAQFYVDGATQGIDQDVADWTPFNSTATLTIGARSGTHAQNLDGYIDDIRIWAVSRSTTEINNNKTKELAGNETNLNAYWPLESTLQDSPSASVSPSSSISASPSPTPSSSISLSPSVSPSVSVSLSISLSPSTSVSLSPSISVSASPSPSVPAGSPSPSLSQSLSISLSPSISPSESSSPSLSASASVSPSSSVSLSESKSESVSNSRSISPSHSASNSRSASLSYSISDSPSPSVSESMYSREDKIALPTDKSDLTTMYTTREEYDVFANDDVFVDLTGVTGKYLIHQFKKLNNNRVDRIKFRVDLKSTIAPSDKTVYLAIWNGQTSSWLVVDSNSIREANTEFSLTGDVSDTSYFDFNNEAAIRVYQQNTTGSNQTLSIDMVRMDFLIRYRDKFESRPIQYRCKYVDKNGR